MCWVQECQPQVRYLRMIMEEEGCKLSSEWAQWRASGYSLCPRWVALFYHPYYTFWNIVQWSLLYETFLRMVVILCNGVVASDVFPISPSIPLLLLVDLKVHFHPELHCKPLNQLREPSCLTRVPFVLDQHRLNTIIQTLPSSAWGRWSCHCSSLPERDLGGQK